MLIVKLQESILLFSPIVKLIKTTTNSPRGKLSSLEIYTRQFGTISPTE